VLNVVTGPGSVVGEEIIRHPLVRKIGFTGETGTGVHVARSAANELKHVTLELGGSDAAIVCDDADLDLAARTVAIGRFFNAGQACLAVKRVYVFESVADEFISKIAARAKRLKRAVARLLRPMGPLHTEKQRAEIESAADAVDQVAVVAGGHRPPGRVQPGYYFEPTVVDVPDGARVWTEETFRCCRSCASRRSTRPWRGQTPPSSAWARASSRAACTTLSVPSTSSKPATPGSTPCK
jgi:succinate-semialdehyde dehydrogenase/glutarate-semialdehyde dehydrogenase